MDVERIRELADVIERLPHTTPDADHGFSMEVYEHPCGTPACIAGWAAHVYNVADHVFPEQNGAAALGMTVEEAAPLFEPLDVCYWSEITPAHAAAVLRNLANTGEIDWSVGAPDPHTQPLMPQP